MRTRQTLESHGFIGFLRTPFTNQTNRFRIPDYAARVLVPIQPTTE